MVNAQYDPFNFKLIRKGVNNIYPKHGDSFRYKYDLWVGDDRDFLVIQNGDSGTRDINGAGFDETESECVNEAIRWLTLGGIAEVNCPYKYSHRHFRFEEFHISDRTDLSYRITLISLKENKYDVYK